MSDLQNQEQEVKSSDFIRDIIDTDLAEKRVQGVVTRFPPEPNGYLHIGHAKSICLNFGIARDYQGRCHLRFDDTNPAKEENEYIDSIQDNVRWLGFDWAQHLYYASDYYGKLHEMAVNLIKKGKAFVCDLNADQIREYRGTLTKPGKESPFRNRSVEENLDLFERMRLGEFAEGVRVLRAKIDMSSPNINMRDPVIYRVVKAEHPRTGQAWCIYPMYDFAHPLSDAIEEITHSICTLEFEDHRPLYDWFVDELWEGSTKPHQYEFARLNLTYTVMSKRKLLQLVTKGLVRGWDDPRMPTIAGLRRRGYTPESIRDFCSRIGVAKSNSIVEIALLEHCLREDLNKRAKRLMVVLNPIKLVIDNYPEGQEEVFECENNPEDPTAGTRKVPFCREVFIERDDFMENPPPKFFRLAPGKEVRLKHAYYVTCQNVVKDAAGNVTEIHCTYDPQSRGGGTPDNRRVQGTLHWVSAKHSVPVECRIYDHLFTQENPDNVPDGKDFTDFLNPKSLVVNTSALAEPALREARQGEKFQFLRIGYFNVDDDSTKEKFVLNRIVSLKDTWSKVAKKA